MKKLIDLFNKLTKEEQAKFIDLIIKSYSKQIKKK